VVIVSTYAASAVPKSERTLSRRHGELGEVAHVADQPHQRLRARPGAPALREVELVVLRGDLESAGLQVGKGQ